MMTLTEQFNRRPAWVSLGRGGGGSGASTITIVRDADKATWVLDTGASADLLGADALNAGVMTAADRQTLDTLGTAGLLTLADLTAASIGAGIQSVRLSGYASVGDGGGGLWARAASEPAHLMKTQTANGVWFEFVLEEIGVNVRAAGAVGDGVTDDKPAIDRAMSLSAHLVFPPGVYRVTGALIPPIHPIDWLGAGADVTRLSTPPNPNSVTILADHDDPAILQVSPAFLNESEGMRIRGIEFRSTSAQADRHAIVFDGRAHWSELKDLTFSDITGFSVAFDPTRAPYCQNMAIRDVSFYNCGGCMGLTADPAPGANYLAVTLLEISNVNLDHTVNLTSPQRYLWDWRAVREVSATTFLNEGASGGSPTTEAVIGLATDSFLALRNVHQEFVTDSPFLIQHLDDTEGQFFGSTETYTLIENYLGPGGIQFSANTEGHVEVRGWITYNATSVDDLASFAGRGGSLRIEGLSVKIPFSVPMSLRGQCEIDGVKSADVAMPYLKRGPARLARWRATDPSWITGYDTAHLSFSKIVSTITSEAVELDGRMLVYRATSPAGETPQPRFNLHLDPEWVGSHVTAVCRYKVTADPTDIGVDFRPIFTDSSVGAESGTQLQIDGGGVGSGDGVWRTGVVSFRASNATPILLSRHLGTAPTQPVDLRIAAFDLFLGTDWSEPLDIPG